MKKITAIMIIAAMLAVMFSFASAYYSAYNTNSIQELVEISNTTNIPLAVTYNTRPTTGQGGVKAGLYIKTGSNEYQYVTGKEFPYFQEVPAMTSYVGSGTTRYLCVKPKILGQQVAGNLTYSFSY